MALTLIVAKNKEKPINKLYRRGNKKDNPSSSSSSRARFSYTENHPTALHHTDDARNQQQQQQQQRWWLSSSSSSWYYYSIPPSIIVGNSSLRQRRSTVGVEPLRLQQQCVYLLPPTIRYEGETIAISRARVVEIIEHTRKTERKTKRKYAISVLNQILPVFFRYATCVCVPRCLLAKNQPLAEGGCVWHPPRSSSACCVLYNYWQELPSEVQRCNGAQASL